MFINESISIMFQILGICFLVELTIILTITSLNFLNSLFKNRSFLNYQKMLNKLTEDIKIKPSSISAVDENLIEKTIEKMEKEDQMILNENDTSESKSNNEGKDTFYKALDNLKKNMDL